MKTFLICLLCILSLPAAKSQYNLVWSDEFNGTSLDSSIWNIESRTGIWNTGDNKELEHYRKENVSVGPDSFGNNCLIITAKKESYDGYNFTSGKIDTKGKVTVKYGKIEARIKMPNVANGLWPAYWLLGDSKDAWPKCGEIDIVEMGMQDGITQNIQNKKFGGALHWDNAGKYAGYPGVPQPASINLYEDYHIYRAEWTPTSIKMYMDDVLYFDMTTSGINTEEFRNNQYFIIFNLAVGGKFTGIYDQAGITASIPAQMLVDYVRVYQKTTEGELNDKPHQMYGNFGVYDETSGYTYRLDMGFDAKIETSGLTSASIPAYEGNTCAAYNTSEGQDFTFSIASPSSRNMSLYNNGSIYFYVKTNFQDAISVSINDSKVTIDNNSPYAFKRDDSWVKVNIPVSAFGNGIRFDSITNFIGISGTGKANTHIAIDKVFWSELEAQNTSQLGIFTDNPNITNRITINDQDVHLYIWDGLASITDTKVYEGEGDLGFKGTGKTWFGFGIFSDNPLDLRAYKNGAMHVTLRTSSAIEFYIGMDTKSNTSGIVTFPKSGSLYGFKRNGTWQDVIIPMADLTKEGLDLSQIGNVFKLGGPGSIGPIYIDDVYLSVDGVDVANPAINPSTDVRTISKNSDLRYYPNPATKLVNINNASEIRNIEVIDISGKTVIKLQQVGDKIDISSLNKGIYFMKSTTNKGTMVDKLIKE